MALRDQKMRRVGIFIATSVCTICCFLFLRTQNFIAHTALDSYNVPYFSTFLVPDDPSRRFTQGGLHEAAMPYERLLKSKGVIDDDGKHYISPSQVPLQMKMCS